MEILAIIALAAAVGVHFWWLRRYRALETGARAENRRREETAARAGDQWHSRLQMLFNHVAEGVLLLDETGRVHLANDAFASLFSTGKDLRGRTLLEATHRHELAELLRSLEPSGKLLSHELRITHPSERWLEVNGAAIQDAAGQTQGTVLVFHDVTRLKQLENARKDFVANVSHELRTPLSLIKGYCETLLDGAQENPEVSRKFLQGIERNSNRLEFLIEDLLTISELESGRLNPQLEPVALYPLVQKVFGELQQAAKTRSVRLINLVPEVEVRADARRLEQVFTNLLENAIKYGGTGNEVRVTGQLTDPAQVEVCVADDGPGIPAESLERVFERFYRVDKARSREQGGTGLGLAIVKHIVLSHKGKVWARSEPGKGAQFYFTLHQNPVADVRGSNIAF